MRRKPMGKPPVRVLAMVGEGVALIVVLVVAKIFGEVESA